VFKKGNALVPTWTAFSVSKLLEQHLPNLVDYEFTAQMEDLLDAISRGEFEHVEYLHNFYFGKEHSDRPGLKPQLDSKILEIDARDLSRFSLGKPESGAFLDEVFVRVGKFGPFVEHGERKASIPQDMPPDELTLGKALEMLEHASLGDEPLGMHPDTHKPVYLKQGRFGPYVQLGSTDEDEKPKNASLLPGMQPTDVTFEIALKLLSLPRTLGDHPTSKEPIVAFNGKFGPYIKCGAETRSLPREISPVDVTMEQAVELLAQPKARGRGRAAAPREPLKTFDKNSPVTEQPVKLLSGRYGNYVTDGTTNATLPKDMTPEELTFEQALDLLAERAARGPSKSTRRGGKTAKKAAAPKRTAKKKASPAAEE
jgi:DNA topoisomerase-1